MPWASSLVVSVVGGASSSCHVSLRGLEDVFQMEFQGADGCVAAAIQELLESCPWPPSPVIFTGIIWSEIMGMFSVLWPSAVPYHTAKGTSMTWVSIPGRIPDKEEKLLVSRLY